MTDFRLLIDGRLVEGAGTLDVINPATGGILTAAPRADRAQLDQAVAAAKAAFPAWSARPLGERGAPLIKLAEEFEAERGEFARLLIVERRDRHPRRVEVERLGGDPRDQPRLQEDETAGPVGHSTTYGRRCITTMNSSGRARSPCPSRRSPQAA
jgi:hypothetical protein